MSIYVVSKIHCQSKWCDGHCHKRLLFYTTSPPTKEDIARLEALDYYRNDGNAESWSYHTEELNLGDLEKFLAHTEKIASRCSGKMYARGNPK